MSAAAAGLEEDRRLVEELRARAEGYKRDGAHMAATPLEDAADRLAAALDERDKLVSAAQARDEENERLRRGIDLALDALDAENEPSIERGWVKAVNALSDAALSAARPSAEGRQAPE